MNINDNSEFKIGDLYKLKSEYFTNDEDLIYVFKGIQIQDKVWIYQFILINPSGIFDYSNFELYNPKNILKPL